MAIKDSSSSSSQPESQLTNALATAVLLETSSTQLDGVPRELEDSVRFQSARLTQAAGVLLRLPEELIAQSIIVLCRFWASADGGSMLEYDPSDVATAALYLAAKPSAHPVSARQILVVFNYLSSLNTNLAPETVTNVANVGGDWVLSEGQYETARTVLYNIESQILRVLGFQTHVALPYNLCVNYLQSLDVFASDSGSTLAKRAFAHLNTALLSPQLLYLTHQPSALATAAVYLAAREVDVKLPEVEWWEVFDVDREELGFLVVALRSVEGYALEEKRRWGRRKIPMTVEDIRSEVERKRMLDEGE